MRIREVGLKSCSYIIHDEVKIVHDCTYSMAKYICVLDQLANIDGEVYTDSIEIYNAIKYKKPIKYKHPEISRLNKINKKGKIYLQT